MLFSALNIFYLYLCQFQFGSVNISIRWLSGVPGGELWTGSPIEDVWYVLVEFAILVCIMLVVCSVSFHPPSDV